ncbi:MAG: PEP-CTERM sorting domain-containing protein [Phycisphaeraceae bacterium]|nr:PEP-CTERM sorting domain-containing protein [Phycisphaeraceae bacterium]
MAVIRLRWVVLAAGMLAAGGWGSMGKADFIVEGDLDGVVSLWPEHGVRKLHVRESREIELGDSPAKWRYFDPFSSAPASPAQDTIWLTEEDQLTIVAPSFQHMPSLGYFATHLTQEGSNIFLDAYFVSTGAATATIYGPHEYLEAIGTLAVGQYTVTTRMYRGYLFGDSGEFDFQAFQDDPMGYGQSSGASPMMYEQSVSFVIHSATEIPEPGTGAMVLAVMAGLGWRRR